MGLKRLLLIILIVLLVLVFFVYRSRQASRGLNIDPHAAREIEKARRRAKLNTGYGLGGVLAAIRPTRKPGVRRGAMVLYRSGHQGDSPEVVLTHNREVE